MRNAGYPAGDQADRIRLPLLAEIFDPDTRQVIASATIERALIRRAAIVRYGVAGCG
jgi:hypothetical protein